MDPVTQISEASDVIWSLALSGAKIVFGLLLIWFCLALAWRVTKRVWKAGSGSKNPPRRY
jgi:hypothetical protein